MIRKFEVYDLSEGLEFLKLWKVGGEVDIDLEDETIFQLGEARDSLTKGKIEKIIFSISPEEVAVEIEIEVGEG